ncbi:Fic family protein [Hephaestia caeni]|uniref:Fic family protein n=1 Tax=Hephaestia caeni TaxID=645617 RepID=UPI001473E290|nr:Fic family protein [Hephaestia caeni]
MEKAIAAKGETNPLAAIEKIHDPKREDIKSRVEELQHPLSPYLSYMDGGVRKSRTSSTEVAIAQHIAKLKSEGLLNAMNVVIEALPVHAKGIRVTQVGTNTDKFGNRGIYPPPHRVPALIDELDRTIRDCEAEAPLWASILAFSGVNAIHPFEDGNGRTARILFNAFMLKRVRGCFYLPIIEIWEISKGGLLIKLRDALHNNNWSDLAEHFCRSYEIMMDG